MEIMMYTIAETLEEVENPALVVPDSAMLFGGAEERMAFVWKAYAERGGHEFVVNVVRFFENKEWIDTWYPIDQEAAERLALDWVNGSDEVPNRLEELKQEYLKEIGMQ